MSKEEKECIIKEGNKTSLMYNKDKMDSYLKEIFDQLKVCTYGMYFCFWKKIYIWVIYKEQK